MAAKQAMKENLQCTSKYGHLRISQDICHVGWQILRASLPYMGIVTICWIITRYILPKRKANMREYHTRLVPTYHAKQKAWRFKCWTSVEEKGRIIIYSAGNWIVLLNQNKNTTFLFNNNNQTTTLFQALSFWKRIGTVASGKLLWGEIGELYD